MNVQGVALKYGVHVLRVGQVPAGLQGPDLSFGCDPRIRMVFYSNQRRAKQQPEKIFHEIIHCIVQPPDMKIGDVPESRILLMFEDHLSRHLHPCVRQRVLDYQSETALDMYDKNGKWLQYLSDLPPEIRMELWDEGLKLCRELGLLNANNQITWQWPDWNKMPLYRERMGW